MKRFYSIFLLSFLYLSQVYAVQSNIDSLHNQLTKSQNIDWIYTAIKLSEEIRSTDPVYSDNLINEAIQRALKQNHKKALAKANLLKGFFSYEDNKVLSGITFYHKAYELFIDTRSEYEAANALYGISEGLSRIHKNKESIDTLNYALIHFSDSIKPDEKPLFYHRISNNYIELGNLKTAMAYLDSAIFIEKQRGLKEDLAGSYNNLGIINLDLGNYKRAVYNYDECIRVAESIKDTLLIAYSMHNKALIYLEWGVYDEALDLFLQSKNLSKILGKEADLANSLSSIASVYHEIKDLEKAKYYYKQAIELAEKFNDISTKSVVLHNLGELLYFDKKYDSAMMLLNQSLRLEMEANNTLGIAQSKSMIATVYSAMQKYPLAFQYFDEAEKVFKKFGSKSDMATLYIELGRTHQRLSNDSLSVLYFNKGIDLANQINARNIILEAYEAASINYEQIGNFQMSLKYYKRFKALNDSLFNENTSMRFDYMTLRLENQEREKQLENLANEKKVLELENKNRGIFLTSIIAGLLSFLAFFIYLYIVNKRSQKQIQEQYSILLESEQKIKALLDSSFDSTLLVDINGTVITANNNDLNQFFPDLSRMTHKPIFGFFSETNQIVLQRFLELVLSSKTYKELQIHERDQKILNIKISPVLDINNQVVSLAFYIKDITQIEIDKKEKKEMENRLIQSQKMETIGTLAGGIAHDFNNYLATIKGYVDMSLEDTEKNSSIHGYLTKTMKAVLLSQQTIQKLLAFSRTNDLVFNKIYFDQILTDSIDILMGSKPRNISLKYPEIKTGITLLGDKNQITQVIINICTNAFHAIDEQNGSVILKIEKIGLIPKLNNKEGIHFTIADNGIGMRTETLGRIFEPFYTTKDVGKGTGLGLSVASGIMKQHAGLIEVDSEFGKGTVFSLYLPII